MSSSKEIFALPRIGRGLPAQLLVLLYIILAIVN